QAPKRCKFVARERYLIRESFHELADDLEWVARSENRVRRRNGEVADAIAVDHVAEIDDPGNPLTTLFDARSAADQNIVIVEIIVDRRFRQRVEKWRGVSLEVGEQLVDCWKDRVAGEQRTIRRDDLPRVREIPIEVAMNGRVVEIGERAVE